MSSRGGELRALDWDIHELWAFLTWTFVAEAIVQRPFFTLKIKMHCSCFDSYSSYRPIDRARDDDVNKS